MKYTAFGLIVGLLLALAGILGGIGGFLFALALGVAFGIVGAHADGLLDVTAVWRGRGRG